MKKFFSKMPLICLLAMVCGVFAGCDPSNSEGGFSVSIQEAGPEYVHVQVSSQGPVEVAYLLDKKEMRVENPVMMFKDGVSLTVKPDDVIRISDGLVEDTQYYLYVVAKLDEINYSEIFTLPFKTTVYDLDEILTVVDRAYDGFKMRITVPEETKQRNNVLRYSQSDIMTYTFMGRNDYSNLLYNGGAYDKFVKDDATIIYSEDTNWYQTGQDSDGDGEIDWDTQYNPISPGEPVVYIAGEFSWMEGEQDETEYYMYPAGWDPGYYKPLLDESYFASAAGDKEQSSMGVITDYEVTNPMDEYWRGAFQRKFFRIREPELLDGGVEMKLVNATPADLTIEFYPDENVEQYAIGIFDEPMYQQLLELCCGREDFLQWAITSYFAAYNFGTGVLDGPAQVRLTDFYYQDAIGEDSEYHVLITSMGNKSGSVQSFQKETFKTTKKVKDAPEIVVTALKDKSTPYEAVFNIKCTSAASGNPVTECYYAANYLRDWLLAINGGSTYFSLVAGNKAYSYFLADEVEKINSEEGYEISIPSIDGETTRLVVLGYNDEYTPNDLTSFEYVEDCTSIADCTTPWLEKKEYVEEKHYIDLVGDWTATAVLQPAKEGSQSFEHSSKITIAADLYDYPSTLSKDVYDLYLESSKYDEAKVNALWAEFKNLADVITKNRLKYQNRLVAMGWLDKDSYDRLDTYTPYDLFVDKTYKSVDVSSIFNDYGPKWYIEAVADEDGNVSLIAPFDSNFLPPSSNYSIPFYFSGLEPDNYTAVTYGDGWDAYFPIEVSEDRNTITIKPLVYTDKEGTSTTFYPNMIGIDNSMMQTVLENPVVSEVVLTRGWTEPEATQMSARSKSVANAQVQGELPAKSYKQRTSLEKTQELKKVEMPLVSTEEFNKRAHKFIEMKFKQNN